MLVVEKFREIKTLLILGKSSVSDDILCLTKKPKAVQNTQAPLCVDTPRSVAEAKVITANKQQLMLMFRFCDD